MNLLKQAYQRLNQKEYKSLIKDTLIPYFDELDGAFVTLLTPRTVFKITPHYYNGTFYGYNIYANKTLLETRETKREAIRFLMGVVNDEP